MEVIDGLLRIKRAREECREAEMHGAMNQFERAAEALREAIALQKRRDQERADREKAMFDDVCKRVVVVRDLNELQSEVSQMKDAAKVDAQEVEQAHTLRLKRRQAFDEATVSWRVAALARQRFADIAARQKEEHDLHLERLAELELEEHPSTSPINGLMAEAEVRESA